MGEILGDLEQIQRLVSDVFGVERHHFMLGSDESETVGHHSFSLGMMAWLLHDRLGLAGELDLEKILKYALVHDFPERGLSKDTHAFASPADRALKAEREKREIAKIKAEFAAFEDLGQTIEDYDQMLDPEARFVWTIDKLQATVFGRMDNWRAYMDSDISYDSYVTMMNKIRGQGSPHLADITEEIVSSCIASYYDQPTA